MQDVSEIKACSITAILADKLLAMRHLSSACLSVCVNLGGPNCITTTDHCM